MIPSTSTASCWSLLFFYIITIRIPLSSFAFYIDTTSCSSSTVAVTRGPKRNSGSRLVLLMMMNAQPQNQDRRNPHSLRMSVPNNNYNRLQQQLLGKHSLLNTSSTSTSSSSTTKTTTTTILHSSSGGSSSNGGGGGSSSSMSMRNTDDVFKGTEKTETINGNKILVTPETIAEMIEVSFVQSCLQLSQGYIDVLKLFIVAVKAGYEHPLSLPTLHTLVSNCPVYSAGRELLIEERELRYEWMKLVYELLNVLIKNTNNDHCDDSSIDRNGTMDYDAAKESPIATKEKDSLVNVRINGVVQSMLSIQTTLQEEEKTSGGKDDATTRMIQLTVDEAIANNESLSQLYESTLNNPIDRAILTNDIRVAILTFRVLEEENICNQDNDNNKAGVDGKRYGGKSETDERVPRPPIPGTGRR